MLRAASEEGNDGGETYEEEMRGGEDVPGEGEYEDGEWAEEVVVSEYEEGGERYDLDEALAELDSDDLVAVIEGAQEDYIESKGQDGGEYADAVEEVELEATGEEGGDQEVAAAEEIEDAGAAQVDDVLVIEDIVDDQPATTLATPERSLATDLSPSTTATAAGSNGLNFSYDTPLGTGLEAHAIPLSASTTTILDAAASNSSAQVEEVETTGDLAGASFLCHPADPTNVPFLSQQTPTKSSTRTTW